MITISLVRIKHFHNKYSGGWDASDEISDEILEFDPITKQWKLVDRMIKARRYHAVSVITVTSDLTCN